MVCKYHSAVIAVIVITINVIIIISALLWDDITCFGVFVPLPLVTHPPKDKEENKNIFRLFMFY